MTRLDLRKSGPSHAASVRAGLAVSSLPLGEIRQTQFATKQRPAFAQGYGSARASLQSKPAEKEER
jgi:hypothetical protein